MPLSNFEIVRAYPGRQQSGVLNFAASRGTPLGALTTDTSASAAAANSFELAGANGNYGQNFLGFLERDCTVAGPTLADHIYPNRLELPYKVGTEVSVIKAAAVEAEGTDFLLTSGTGALTTSTAVGTKISFRNGKFSAAQSGEIAYFTVAANNLTPYTASALRMRFEAVGS